MRNWSPFVRQTIDKFNSNKTYSQRIARSVDFAEVPLEKLDVCLPYSKIMENIKKVIIRNVMENVGRNWDNSQLYHPRIFNDSFYSLDFDVTLVVTDTYRYEHVNPEGSPYLSLLDIIENLSIAPDVNPSRNLILNLLIVYQEP